MIISKVEPLTKDGMVVATPDRDYTVEGSYIHFDELILSGLLEGAAYKGHVLKLLYAYSQIGVLVDNRGARGPLLQGAMFSVES